MKGDAVSSCLAMREAVSSRLAMREAVYSVIGSRRDVRRRFLGDPVPRDVVDRVLLAAHQAPSVGLSQPWDFLLVTDDAVRRRVAAHVEEQRRVFAASLTSSRGSDFDRLKIQAILDAPLNLVVTSTLERGGVRVLGRHIQPETAAYSTCLAIENLWLAARAEGLGVGWVSFYEPGELSALLDLPPHVTPIAYLCIGWVEDFDAEPELAQAGWASPRPLHWAVHHERWGQHEGMRPFEEAIANVARTRCRSGPRRLRAPGQAHQAARIARTPGGPRLAARRHLRDAATAGARPCHRGRVRGGPRGGRRGRDALAVGGDHPDGRELLRRGGRDQRHRPPDRRGRGGGRRRGGRGPRPCPRPHPPQGASRDGEHLHRAGDVARRGAARPRRRGRGRPGARGVGQPVPRDR